MTRLMSELGPKADVTILDFGCLLDLGLRTLLRVYEACLKRNCRITALSLSSGRFPKQC
jgi:hypothetical protein